MKKLWARVGTTFQVTDENYEKLKIAMEENDHSKVHKILYDSLHQSDGESYLPADCDDNPNTDDFDF